MVGTMAEDKAPQTARDIAAGWQQGQRSVKSCAGSAAPYRTAADEIRLDQPGSVVGHLVGPNGHVRKLKPLLMAS